MNRKILDFATLHKLYQEHRELNEEERKNLEDDVEDDNEDEDKEYKFVNTKEHGLVVGTDEQLKAFFGLVGASGASLNNRNNQRATIVKKANPQDIASTIESKSSGTRLMNYKNLRFPIKEDEYTLKKNLNQLFVSCKDEKQKNQLKEEIHEYCNKLSKFCKTYSVEKTDEINRIAITSIPKLASAIIKDSYKTFKNVENCIEQFKLYMIMLELLGETKGEIKANKVTIQLLKTYEMKQFGKFVAK